jgi:hypothetical protein
MTTLGKVPATRQRDDGTPGERRHPDRRVGSYQAGHPGGRVNTLGIAAS